MRSFAKASIWVAAVIALQIPGNSFAAEKKSMADTMFATANSADVAEEYDDAAKKYRDLIVNVRGTDPGNPLILRAKARLARICLLQSHFDDAEPLFYSLMTSDHDNLARTPELMIDLDDLSDAYTRMAKTPHYRYESLKRCVELRKRINQHHPRLPGAYRDLAQYCVTCNNLKEASQWILKAIDLEKNVPSFGRSDLILDENFLALVYMLQDQLDKAQQTAQEGLELLPRDSTEKFIQTQMHTTLGSIYKKKRLYEKAAKEYDISLKGIDSKFPQADIVRTRILQLVKQNDEERRKAAKRNH